MYSCSCTHARIRKMAGIFIFKSQNGGCQILIESEGKEIACTLDGGHARMK